MTSALHLRIRQARNEAGLAREPLAVKLGISVSTLRNYETGRTEPRYQMLRAIAEETGKPLSYFVAEVAA